MKSVLIKKKVVYQDGQELLLGLVTVSSYLAVNLLQSKCIDWFPVSVSLHGDCPSKECPCTKKLL